MTNFFRSDISYQSVLFTITFIRHAFFINCWVNLGLFAPFVKFLWGAIMIFVTNCFDVATNIHINGDFGFLRFDGFKKVCENYFSDGFVENFLLSKGVNVEFERL